MIVLQAGCMKDDVFVSLLEAFDGEKIWGEIGLWALMSVAVLFCCKTNKHHQILTEVQRWKKAQTSWCLFFGISADFKRFQLIYSPF